MVYQTLYSFRTFADVRKNPINGTRNLIQIELLIYYIVPVAQTSNGIHEMI